MRIIDRDQTWRIVYYIASDAIVVLDVFSKKTQATPIQTLKICRKRLASYLRAVADKE